MSKTNPINSSPQVLTYNRYFEYQRIVSTVTVTDEGNFIEDNVPDDYGGAELDIEIVHAVRMVNSRAELLLFEFYNEPAMDKDRKKGGPVHRDGEEIAAATGDSTVPTLQITRVNPTLTDEQKEAGEFSMAIFEQDRKDTPRSPQY